MSCDRCGEREGRIQYTEVRDGRVEKQWICPECADALGFGLAAEDPGGEFPPVGAGAVDFGLSPAAPEAASGEPLKPEVGDAEPEASELRCPGCGITEAELRGTHLLGCPECWDAFAERLDGLLRKLHGTGLHRGRLPGGVTARPPDPEELRRRIEEAIRDEDFETAARLRDRLRRADGGPA